MEFLELWVKCSRCRGTKIDENLDPPGPCLVCGATGYVPGDIIDITSLQSDIDSFKNSLTNLPTFLILENMDLDEYLALDDKQKSWYDLCISACRLDVREKSKIRELLLDWIFPEGTKTHKAILEILINLSSHREVL